MNLFKKSFHKKDKRKIPNGKYRVIKISKDALFEFIYESFIDNQECFLDVSDGTSIVTSFNIDYENAAFICVARNEELESEEQLQFDDIDTEKLLKNMKDTTSTMYADNRYIELTQEEIEAIQNI